MKEWFAVTALAVALPGWAAEPAEPADPTAQALHALQQQVEALSQRIVELEAEQKAERLDASHPTELEAPAAPADSNTARNPQDATSVPGTVSIGPSIPAWPVASGGETARVTLSGQINRGLLYGDDGFDHKVRDVDNNNSSTRLRIFAVGQLDPDTFVGGQIETELRSNTSARVHLHDDGANSSDSTSFSERQIEVVGFSRHYGRVRLGQGSTASDESTQADLSDTGLASGVQVSDFDGGFEFREKHSGELGPAVSGVFNYFAGLGRDDRLRYDLPDWNGITASASAADGGAWDGALRYAGQSQDFRVIAAVAYANATSRDPPLPGVTALDSTQWSGSVSMLYRPLGLSLTLAAGTRDVDYEDANGQELDPRLWYGKIGWQHRFVSFGGTAFSVDYARNDDLSLDGDEARAYGFQAVQHVDRIGTDVFLGYRHEKLDREGVSYEPIEAILSGVRVRF